MAASVVNVSLFRDPRKRQGKQQNSLQAKVAARGIVPFVDGVRSAAGTAGADGDGLAAQRQRNVGVGRGALHASAVVEMRIYRADHPKQMRIRGKLCRRTIAD